MIKIKKCLSYKKKITITSIALLALVGCTNEETIELVPSEQTQKKASKELQSERQSRATNVLTDSAALTKDTKAEIYATLQLLQNSLEEKQEAKTFQKYKSAFLLNPSLHLESASLPEGFRAIAENAFKHAHTLNKEEVEKLKRQLLAFIQTNNDTRKQLHLIHLLAKADPKPDEAFYTALTRIVRIKDTAVNLRENVYTLEATQFGILKELEELAKVLRSIRKLSKEVFLLLKEVLRDVADIAEKANADASFSKQISSLLESPHRLGQRTIESGPLRYDSEATLHASILYQFYRDGGCDNVACVPLKNGSIQVIKEHVKRYLEEARDSLSFLDILSVELAQKWGGIQGPQYQNKDYIAIAQKKHMIKIEENDYHVDRTFDNHGFAVAFILDRYVRARDGRVLGLIERKEWQSPTYSFYSFCGVCSSQQRRHFLLKAKQKHKNDWRHQLQRKEGMHPTTQQNVFNYIRSLEQPQRKKQASELAQAWKTASARQESWLELFIQLKKVILEKKTCLEKPLLAPQSVLSDLQKSTDYRQTRKRWHATLAKWDNLDCLN